MSSIVWLRLDLRLEDNPALFEAGKTGGAIVPLFIWSPEEEGDWQAGGASKWWLHQSLKSLDLSLRKVGSRLSFRLGPSLQTLIEVSKEVGARAIYWNRRYEPTITGRDSEIKATLQAEGLIAQSFNSALLHEPWTIRNQSGKPFQVFTPYWKRCLSEPEPPAPLPIPARLPAPSKWPKTLRVGDLELEPKHKWTDGLAENWTPGEEAARGILTRFLEGTFEDYSMRRNRPDLPGTSRLSPYLHFGELGPRQVWHEIQKVAARCGWSETKWRNSQFLAEIGWREFAHHLVFHFPNTPQEPLRNDFKKFPWRKDADWLAAWQKGLTGYPIVDAGMRELWRTGWMHNRLRMIVASFLVKDLLLSWQSGARWFWETLVDADLAQNTLGWQWTAGCGADAAPYFRVFNPASQGQKFDPDGTYVRRWCPELADLPTEWIHQPSEAPAQFLAAAGVELGNTYPQPLVRHSLARELALDAYRRMKAARPPKS